MLPLALVSVSVLFSSCILWSFYMHTSVFRAVLADKLLSCFFFLFSLVKPALDTDPGPGSGLAWFTSKQHISLLWIQPLIDLLCVRASKYLSCLESVLFCLHYFILSLP